VTRFRPFRNTDPPALARLWNRAIPETGTARPLRPHELDSHAFGRVNFDAAGLIIAETDGRIVGFAHAGFGPDTPVDPARPLELNHEIGTVAMLVVEPEQRDPELVAGLISEAENYLRKRGAKVVYAGGQFPLNPFYWGIYGGTEGSGVLSGHQPFSGALAARGYQPASTTVLLEADLSVPEPRDPRGVLIRRQAQLEFQDDALPDHWWQGLALGDFQLMNVRLVSRSDRAPLGMAQAWDMSWFGRGDSRSRIGLISLEVSAAHRRKGYGRFLVSEILRRARENHVDLVAVQTAATNAPALALYASLGFKQIEEATCFRLRADSGSGS
jgi:ribosomal protein S18 acetylase RimI-like enzyme